MKKPHNMGIFHAIDYSMNDVGHVLYKSTNASKLVVKWLEVGGGPCLELDALAVNFSTMG